MLHRACFYILFSLYLSGFTTPADAQADTGQTGWELNAQLSWYGTPDYSFLMPCFTAQRKHLYLQGRYNYEDLETASFFAGYRFYGGQKLHYELATSAGFILGQTRGLSPDLDLQLTWRRWSLSSESEYLFNLEQSSENYYYQWTDLYYAPLEWLWAGLSAQRTRIYHTGLDVQRGIVAGASAGDFSFSGYLFNILNRETDIFGILSVAYDF